jgi:hypothetical protein
MSGEVTELNFPGNVTIVDEFDESKVMQGDLITEGGKNDEGSDE